jgi:putative endonuclease
MDDKPWHLYIVKCNDGKLYTGISNNVEKRIAAHNKGHGCRFTKYRYPVVLKYQEHCGSKSVARCREIEIKKLTRQEKLKLIEGEALRS